MNIGLLGELHVEQRLIEHGWHTVRLDTSSMASNADLLALNKKRRVSIQVKTTNAESGHSHSKFLSFGYSTSYIRNGLPIFNSKKSPLIADIVVGVSYRQNDSRFVVMPVAFAEKLCRLQCKYWSSVPKKDGGVRSDSFPIYLAFTAERQTHREFHERMKKNLIRYENAWDCLSEPITKLHDSKSWNLIK